MQNVKLCCFKLVRIGNPRKEVGKKKKKRRQNREHLGTSFKFMANVLKERGRTISIYEQVLKKWQPVRNN